MSRKRVPEEERDALRRWMRFAVGASGLSANKLAKAAGVAQSTVTRFINGYADYAPSRATVEKLAAAAKVDPPKLGDWDTTVHALLTENNDCRNLISEAVRLADRLVHDETFDNDPAALRKNREALLPRYTLTILDALADLQKGGRLDDEAITIIETTLRRVGLNRHRQSWEGNDLSPLRDSAEPQHSSDPQSEASDTSLDEPARKAAPGDTDTPPLAA